LEGSYGYKEKTTIYFGDIGEGCYKGKAFRRGKNRSKSRSKSRPARTFQAKAETNAEMLRRKGAGEW
jgi:hypothetical protein